ncbi:unnamed protein product, partial [Didymodactylos carnosus]
MTGEAPRSSTISTVNNDVIESKPQGSSITEKYRYKRKDQSFLKTHKIGTWNKEWSSPDCKQKTHQFDNTKNDRMISIRLQGRPTNLTIIQIYAPTTEAEESIIEDFYMELQQLLDDVPKKDTILIIGDWNAKVGEIEVPGIAGKFGLGKRNEAGDRLIEFCQDNHMVITNTCFQQPKRRLYTWTTPNGQHRNQIDYILCNRRWKSSITSIKTRPGADCGTDHELLLASFRIKLKHHHKSTQTTKPDLQNIPYKYKVAVKNRFNALNLIDKEPEELWQEIRDIINDETKRNIPTIQKKKKNNWISSSTLEIAKKRREVKSNGNRQAFTKLNVEFQRAARKDKEKQIMQECEKVEEYNRKDLDNYEPEPDILENEVTFAMETLASGKAPGHDGIPIECFKTIKEDTVK